MWQYIDNADVSVVILELELSIAVPGYSDIVYDGRKVSGKVFNEDVCNTHGMEVMSTRNVLAYTGKPDQ